jgi:hypothetical protein
MPCTLPSFAESSGADARSTLENFTNLITLEMKTESETHRVSGTVFNDRLPRIVNIDGFALEVIPRGHMIYFTNNDRPGVMEESVQSSANADVNIAGMQLGRSMKVEERWPCFLWMSLFAAKSSKRYLSIDNILTAQGRPSVGMSISESRCT